MAKSSKPTARTHNPQAPFVFFDQVAAQGTLHDVVHFELEAVITIPDGERAINQLVTTAHLRCSLIGLRSLKEAIEKIELMRAPTNPASN